MLGPSRGDLLELELFFGRELREELFAGRVLAAVVRQVVVVEFEVKFIDLAEEVLEDGFEVVRAFRKCFFS